MLTDARTCGSYSEQYSYDYGKETLPQIRQKEPEASSRKSSEDPEENWARIELSTNKLYKYRKYDVRLLVKKIMRIRSGVSEIDILKSLLSAKCCCEGTRSEPFCNKCHAPKVVSLDTAKNTQNIKVDRGEYEIYTDHLHASLVLVVDGFPFTRPLVSTPFGLFSREKKTDKKQANTFFPILGQINPASNEPPGYGFGYSEPSRENEGNRENDSSKSTYPGYPGEQDTTVSVTKNYSEYIYDTSNFIGMETTALSTSVAMPTESFDNNAMFDYDNYTEKYGSYMDTNYTQSNESTQLQQQQQQQQKYQAPLPPPQSILTKDLYSEPNDDFRYLMPEYFVSCIQQNCLTLGPPPGDPSIVGTGEGAPDPSDCF